MISSAFLASELAAVLYCDEVIDGSGRVITSRGLRSLDSLDMVDSLRSVSGLTRPDTLASQQDAILAKRGPSQLYLFPGDIDGS